MKLLLILSFLFSLPVLEIPDFHASDFLKQSSSTHAYQTLEQQKNTDTRKPNLTPWIVALGELHTHTPVLTYFHRQATSPVLSIDSYLENIQARAPPVLS